MKSFALFAVLMPVWVHSWAAGNFVTLNGDVRLEMNGKATSTAINNQRIEEGATVHTGPNGNAILRLDDGQQVALSANTTFMLDQFRFNNAKPEQNNVTMSLFKGALRILTGLIGQRDNSKFALKTSVVTVGIRGTDFMVAVVNPVGAINPAYVQVMQGGVSATNAAGTAAFAAGSTATVAGVSVLPMGIAASALPAAVSATFANLGSLALAGAGAAGAGATSGAGGAAGGAAGGGAGAAGASSAAIGGVAAAGIAVGAVAVTAIIVSNKSTSTGTTGTQ